MRNTSHSSGDGGGVMPVESYSRLDKPRRRDSPPPTAAAPRFAAVRGWIGFFLLVNLFGIVGFIFTSALYFPSASPSGMLKQAIKQGDVSLLELPPSRATIDAPEKEEKQDETTIPASDPPPLSTDPVKQSVDDRETEASAVPRWSEEAEATTQPPPLDQQQEHKHRLRSETTVVPAIGNEPASPIVTATAATETKAVIPQSEAVVISNEVAVTSVVSVETRAPRPTQSQEQRQGQDQDQLPSPAVPTLEPLASAGKSHSMSEILRRMKEQAEASKTPVAPKSVEQKTTQVVVAETADPTVETAAFDPTTPAHGDQEVSIPTAATPAMETNLLVWLKADEGVEVENAVECETLGTSCGVVSWKSQVNPYTGPVVFQPVDSYRRPVLQPMAQRGLHVVSFTCPMAHTNGVVLREKMTLFFVLSPSQITRGDSYLAQKFFGNSPYGQFLFHGGKPGFFTTGGLRESSSVVVNDAFVVVAYRLHRHAVEIKVNDGPWSAMGDDDESFSVHMSGNAALSLGNVKSACDTNAFQGRIAEVLIYETVLLDARVSEVEKYLRHKWLGGDVEPAAATTAQRGEEENELVATTAPDQERVEVVVESTATEAPVMVASPSDPQQQEKQQQDHETTEPNVAPPRTFEPEGVFEWLPSKELLAVIAQEQGRDSSPLVSEWNKAVSGKVETIRNFQFGGEILRSFIRGHRDELLALRDELFGN